MQSRLVFRRNKVMFDHCSKLCLWSSEVHAFRTSFDRVSSHQTKDPECIAESSNIPWNPPTIRHPDRTATAPQMSLLSLCASLYRQAHLFLICDVQCFQCNSSQNLQNCKELMTFGFLVGSKKTSSGSSGSPEKFVLHGYDCIHCVAKSCTTTENW